MHVLEQVYGISSRILVTSLEDITWVTHWILHEYKLLILIRILAYGELHILPRYALQ